ncbi:fumarate hydratase subunit beta [Dysgonomonas sp. PFB1-18]|uniref:Fe-S-containing hydro-lyase n=1 Tax=unclassified Dysgonomonas TaxID=2630389 RepID=UPI0024742427|nr:MULTISPECIES: Fe-S-containing hydro-lyase [unclassified Dysgonomonas]MDH6311084.1 fumarate hydratase subunit beta [Dysgonomonas sp. PF1-14]MDH6340943.1 fumarate hydratase subunit beta [Dysgonomonas sp. PF1-16]MDH6382610.1 fumarate hydratase subunit beta [Dysgonomonas sp. PFB1-18]MDH6399949.1 fumarate hydratase subunit beta [Dysgonomonas sp. PF1-23]
MKDRIEITTPFSDEMIKSLKAGDMAYISGVVYTARDAAHKRMCELLDKDEPMPFDFKGAAIYYAGPCPAKPGTPIGSVGPTTSGRMDLYSPRLIAKGLRVMIGKGLRNQEVTDAIIKHSGVYFAAIGGAAALMGKCVESAEVIAFDELGTEAVRRLIVKDLPVIVAIDCHGNNMYEEGRKKYSTTTL